MHLSCNACHTRATKEQIVYPLCTECNMPIAITCANYFVYDIHIECDTCNRVVCCICAPRFRHHESNNSYCSAVCARSIIGLQEYRAHFVYKKQHGHLLIRVKNITSNTVCCEEFPLKVHDRQKRKERQLKRPLRQSRKMPKEFVVKEEEESKSSRCIIS
jgi:hypothetical protein